MGSDEGGGRRLERTGGINKGSGAGNRSSNCKLLLFAYLVITITINREHLRQQRGIPCPQSLTRRSDSRDDGETREAREQRRGRDAG